MQLARPARPAILAPPGLVVALLAPPALREAPDLLALQVTLARLVLAGQDRLVLLVLLELPERPLLPWVRLGRQVIPARPGLPEPRLPLLVLLDLPAILALQVRRETPPPLLVLQAQQVRLVLLAMRLRLLVLLAQPGLQETLARPARLDLLGILAQLAPQVI